MPSVTLNIRGYRDEIVPHRLLRQAQGQHLGVLLPGLNYTADRSLLYFAFALLDDLGADVLRLDTGYGQRPDYLALDADEQRHWLIADTTAAILAVLAERAYERVTIIGKSLGTLAMGHLLTTEAALATAEAVWLTPLLTHPVLRQQLLTIRQPSLLVVGDADPNHDPALLTRLLASRATRAVVVVGGEHSLEIIGDVIRSIQALEHVARAMQSFLTDPAGHTPGA